MSLNTADLILAAEAIVNNEKTHARDAIRAISQIVELNKIKKREDFDNQVFGNDDDDENGGERVRAAP